MKKKYIGLWIVEALIAIALIIYAVFWWTNCAFTDIKDAPVICIAR